MEEQKLKDIQGLEQQIAEHRTALEKGKAKTGGMWVTGWGGKDRAQEIARLEREVADTRKAWGLAPAAPSREDLAGEAKPKATGGAPVEKPASGPPSMEEAQAAKTMSPAEARKLKPGTVFRTPEGKLMRVKV